MAYGLRYGLWPMAWPMLWPMASPMSCGPSPVARAHLWPMAYGAHTYHNYYRHLGIADGMFIERVWACRYSKMTVSLSAMPRSSQYVRAYGVHNSAAGPPARQPARPRAYWPTSLHAYRAAACRWHRLSGPTLIYKLWPK